jgi:hypothetical protein
MKNVDLCAKGIRRCRAWIKLPVEGLVWFRDYGELILLTLQVGKRLGKILDFLSAKAQPTDPACDANQDCPDVRYNC